MTFEDSTKQGRYSRSMNFKDWTKQRRCYRSMTSTKKMPQINNFQNFNKKEDAPDQWLSKIRQKRRLSRSMTSNIRQNKEKLLQIDNFKYSTREEDAVDQ